MQNDIQKINHNPYGTVLSSSISAFDMVLVGDENYLGVVETVTNMLYHVVYRDSLGHAVHAVYTKDQLQKILIVVPHTHE